MQELEIALPQKISFWPIQAASRTLTPGSNESNPVCPQMSPAMKSSSETSRATAAPPTTGFGGQPREQCGFLQPTVSSQRTLETPWGPSAALEVSPPSRNSHRTSPSPFKAEGGALRACRKHSRVTLHITRCPSTHGAGRLLPKLLLGM